MSALKKFAALALVLSLSVHLVSAQDWVTKMKDPSVNFFDVQEAFNKYYVKKERQVERMKKQLEKQAGEGVSEEEIEVPGYEQYKRWEWFMAPRVAVNGERFNPAAVYNEYRNYSSQNGTFSAGNWTLIGPTNNIPSSGGGAGRVNFVRFDPTNGNTIYVGSPGGGLWKSTDGGATWSSNTDHIGLVIGCTDIAIDPTNTNIMYLATGDGDAGDTYTVGILKTTDGGNTWNTTGLSYYMANFRQISKILIDPSNTNTILVASTGGIFRSTDGATTFNLVQAGSFKDIEFKPGDPSTIYTCGTEFYRSSDNGQTWSKITSVFPAAANLSRMAIAVTPDDNNYVYVLSAKAATDYGFEGLYRSTNSGTSFTKITVTSPSNILGWNSNGGDTGGQGWYDLGFAVSPTNKNDIVTGGVNIWRSTNGGTSFTLNGHWTGTGAPYVHADVHDLVYVNGTTVYAGCDGGVFTTSNNGGNWSDLSNGLHISQMYGFGQSQSNPNLLIQGWQDNGTNRYNGSNWTQIMGGDGMLCFIDRTNDQNMWGSLYNGNLQRSTNGGASFNSANGNINETGAWVTPWIQDPVTAGTIYAGFVNVWKSTNGGVSWTKISTFSNSGTLNTIAVSPANNQVIWAAKASGLYKTSNGGTNWTTITNLPSGTITGIACSDTDPNKVWVSYSGFTNANKVFYTSDQGVTWVSLSASIPNVPVNCITYVNGSNDALYIGTDIGVFFRDASMNVWQAFFNGLPNVVVTQIGVYNPTGKIRASTYGRGIWESDPYVPGAYAPTTAFGSNKKFDCPGTAIQFTDYSGGLPTSWSWSFPGGSPSSSTQQNPVVVYNTAGVYPVTLVTNNANGTDSVTYQNYINITPSSQSNPVTVSAQRCGPGTVNLSASGSGLGVLRWWDAPGGGNLLATGSTYSPFINATTSFYVDEEFQSGNIDFTGEYTNTIGTGAFFTANDIRGLYFDVLNPVILNSVDVFANTAGNRTIEVLDAQGNTVIDTTINIPASGSNPYTVNLNFPLYPGNNYFIKCRGYVDLYRNSGGAVYPYTSSDVNITGSNAGSPGYYYFFYNWIYSEITCNTGRTECIAHDTCNTVGINEIAGNNSISINPNPGNGIFDLKIETGNAGTYDLEIVNSLGQIIFSKEILTPNGSYQENMDLSKSDAGLYLIRIAGSNFKATKKLLIEK